jgi:LacI family transcriptional regulator
VTTLVDVARRAGVSKSTVSNVIRGSTLVAGLTRERVERAIAATGYQPNAIARSLKARTSAAIGVVVPDLRNPFYAELAVSIEEAVNDLGYAVLAANTECRPKAEAEACRELIGRRVDGVIVAGIALASVLPKAFLDHDVPVVLAAFGELDDPRLGVIDHDDVAAMEAVVDHLHGLGHRRIAFVPLPHAEHSGERRRVAVEAALARRGLMPADPEGGATAIVAHNDVEALATIDRLERSGRRVPDDVSIVGFDDVPIGAHVRIGLTTVRSDASKLGRRAVELVVGAARAGRHVAHRELQESPLIIRRTTGSPPA